MKHLLFDTETTQLVENSLRPIQKQPRIIEIFMLLLDQDLEELETYHSLINPGMPIPAQVTKITGIDDEKVKDAPGFSLVAPSIKALIEEADVIAAHNLSFDMAVVDFEFERLNNGALSWPDRRICTVESTEHFKGHRLNLTALHTELFGEGFEKAHSAENDVRAMARCYKELVTRGEI